ncbi:MAG: hypothetical protein UU77_C0004G0003 [candidate division WWE3 bacterium GW2011_GWC1_41_7]|uniref:VTT domain-containing protein n=4 Tax=Katanobacteria TaxID=422282 RepID=A0A0G0XCJ5_UNCKA|nr:MAG: hypothetical protein UU77_C0004G0003 [candidate division WWE3 bacterium GW2011_GWC1_41_7]KKS22649.1 MAG: hypothetical protein UU80_C0004G0039 [candidate division WWE3 bacterium GW2011_GWA1_41_8]OGC57349.1 MAG: hypothetical protein A2976_02490 [candidate division WWE3 bacterium RIFCSPLOWO2_01_FULL_41_9]
MSEIIQSLLNHDLRSFVEQIGYIGTFFVIFAESGLLIGFFLPGDSLIFTAGLLASPKFAFFNIWVLLIGSWIAAVVGDNVGYEFGKRMGKRLFLREKSFLFNPGNLLKAQEFYEKHGGKAIVIARFMPVVRTFAPIVAGIAHMDHKRFTFFNFIGGTLWIWGVGLAGYFLGNLLPNDESIDTYLLPIIFLIVFISVAPPAVHLYKENHKSWNQKVLDVIKRFRYSIFK